MKPLAIIPTYVRGDEDLTLLAACLASFRATANGKADILIVDDGSPGERTGLQTLIEMFGPSFTESEVDLVLKRTNDGFAKTVNVGLRRALEQHRDAILVNADIEFGIAEHWVEMMVDQENQDGEPASIVGALLLYPNHTIQHAGVFFSMLYREFGHIYNHGPHNLPEALNARECPVTGALQFIRWDCLDEIGLYDETFKMGWEDVDYCIRAWQAGRSCVYQPGVRAIHHESAFRGQAEKGSKLERWQHESWLRFVQKYATTNFAEFVPNLS